jgi:DNA gyrase inhibitor GyrI
MTRKNWIFGAIAATAAGFAWWFYKTSRAGVPNADYITLRADGKIELRRYPELVVATTPMQGDRGQSFRRLFRYIDRGNENLQKIAMTSPVLFDRSAASMSFVLPPGYTSQTAPDPADGEVGIDTRPAGTYASIRFSGNVDENAEREALSALRKWMLAEDLPQEGEPIAAYYDSPMTPGPLRRNEILIRTSR